MIRNGELKWNKRANNGIRMCNSRNCSFFHSANRQRQRHTIDSSNYVCNKCPFVQVFFSAEAEQSLGCICAIIKSALITLAVERSTLQQLRVILITQNGTHSSSSSHTPFSYSPSGISHLFRWNLSLFTPITMNSLLIWFSTAPNKTQKILQAAQFPNSQLS